MNSKLLLTLGGFFLSSSMLVIIACSSSPQRQPSSTDSLVTRNQKQVVIPNLTTQIFDSIPLCPEKEEDRAQNKDECRKPGEEELFKKIVDVSFKFQSAQNPPSISPSQRDFHPKQHACIAARWTPLPHLSSRLAVGAFKLKYPVKAILRYSNGSPKSPDGSGKAPPDIKADGRGLAIKLVGVRGQSVLDYEGRENNLMNQDFILINDMSFFLKSPESYPAFLDLLTQGKPFFQLLDETEKKVLIRTSHPISDSANEKYFSQTPYVLGSEKVKYQVRPCKTEKEIPVTESEKANPNFLRDRLAKRILEQPLCLIFAVQFRKPFMDVENPSVDWQESDSRFIDVARITAPKGQNINDLERDKYCENISFNPWNTMIENRPAGGINRARLAVYSAISRKRRLENDVPIREPKRDDSFFNSLIELK